MCVSEFYIGFVSTFNLKEDRKKKKIKKHEKEMFHQTPPVLEKLNFTILKKVLLSIVLGFSSGLVWFGYVLSCLVVNCDFNVLKRSFKFSKKYVFDGSEK